MITLKVSNIKASSKQPTAENQAYCALGKGKKNKIFQGLLDTNFQLTVPKNTEYCLLLVRVELLEK